MSWNRLEKSCVHVHAFKSGLQDFVEPGTQLWSLLLEKYEACKVYTLELDKVGDGKPPKTIEDALVCDRGWRFLASDGAQNGACHVGGGSLKVTGFSSAPEIASAVNYIREIEATQGISPADYELRVLRIPWLRFEAFWLFSNYGRQLDLVFPYTRFAKAAKLRPMTQYTAEDFLKPIWDLAVPIRAKKASDDAEKARSQEKLLHIRSAVAHAEAKRLENLAEKEKTKAAGLDADAARLHRPNGDKGAAGSTKAPDDQS
jgi:hypothetical protein